MTFQTTMTLGKSESYGFKMAAVMTEDVVS